MHCSLPHHSTWTISWCLPAWLCSSTHFFWSHYCWHFGITVFHFQSKHCSRQTVWWIWLASVCNIVINNTVSALPFKRSVEVVTVCNIDLCFWYWFRTHQSWAKQEACLQTQTWDASSPNTSNKQHCLSPLLVCAVVCVCVCVCVCRHCRLHYTKSH